MQIGESLSIKGDSISNWCEPEKITSLEDGYTVYRSRPMVRSSSMDFTKVIGWCSEPVRCNRSWCLRQKAVIVVRHKILMNSTRASFSHASRFEIGHRLSRLARRTTKCQKLIHGMFTASWRGLLSNKGNAVVSIPYRLRATTWHDAATAQAD